MSAKSTFGLIGLSMVGGVVAAAVGMKVLAAKYGLMKRVMITTSKSKFGFNETVSAISESAINHGWQISHTHDLQQEYMEAGHEDMTKVKIIYFCNPEGGYRILKDDADKPMSVMMPLGVSVWEAEDGRVYISAMHLKGMSAMFGGTVKDVLNEGAENYAQTLENIVEESDAKWGLSQIPARMMAWMMQHMPDE